uniref:Uncharacterized protein n=1 Tax=Candidatus Kentrum sp. MB TaxID=2138164 RepID=A0A451B7U9_9GAMM|nr:MAG: hypothetical protein BECKMB1821I_GA0114274_100374 [Candidatus Kentron sp. MB]VFK31614.1 MAG: hypothetical protein BECKMB1821G_GA0114241_10889 [Candidatus Kentron sp. MB]VFK74344.1 MAG: hypothetical protein BECKMB1821H_GA0114242_100374 [Candidatus Kentron sp. MB]
MPFDLTATWITIALIGAGIFFVLELLWKKDIDVINSAVIFSVIYAIYQGYLLIEAALIGDPNNLPKTWRAYLGFAGVVVIGLSLQYIVKTFRKIIAKPGNKKEINNDNEC